MRHTVELQPHSFLTSALDGGDGWPQAPNALRWGNNLRNL